MPYVLTLTLLCAAPPLVGPADELRAAVRDLEANVAPARCGDVRYVSFYNLPPAERMKAAAVFSLVLNSVSRADVIVRPQEVPQSEGRLYRFSLADYRLPREAWERLASQDPYWHLRTRVVAPTDGKPQLVFTDGGWVDLAAAARLRELTGSGGALLRGDFFLAQATTTLDGGAYYDLAGVAATENEFFQSLGLDVATIGELGGDGGANALRSLVTFKPRRIVRRQGPLGGAWHTYDTAAATAERDPLRNPFAFEYDAGEHIAAKRNGLHLYALYDRAGRRQDSVPDVVAKDTTDPHGSGIVVPMISCVRCHVEDGLRPVANDQRRLLERGVELCAADPGDAQRLASFYFADLEKHLRRDREDYAAAVALATGGLGGAEAAAALATLVERYRNELVDLKRAGEELGTAPEALAAALRTTHDPILAALVVGAAVDRKQWEASCAEAALLVAPARK